jgi:hypothetical protein
MIIAWGSLMQAARRGEVPLVKFGCGPAYIASHGKQPVYLATPYTKRAHVDGVWSHSLSVELMLEAAAEVGRLKWLGVSAFSPIVASASVVHAALPGSNEFAAHHPFDATGWLRWCQPFLNVCGAVVVPDLPGWDQSAGIKAEVAFAIGRGVPVFVYAAGDDDGI